MRLAHHVGPLFLLLSDVEEPDDRPLPAEEITEVDRPEDAKPTSSLADASMLAPPSRTRTGSPPVGNRVATVARSTPSWRPRRTVEAARIAPVLPAETKASDLPFFWRDRPTTMLELGFRRTAASGFSPMPMTSGASCTSMRVRSTPACRVNSASIDVGSPDELDYEIVRVAPRAHRRTPAISACGALSPPIASTATRITLRRPRPRPASCRGSSRRTHKHDGTAWAIRSAGMPG